MKTFLLKNPKRILALASLAGVCGLFGTASAQATHPERVYANSQGYNITGLTLGTQPSVTGASNPTDATSIKDSSVLSTGSGVLSVLPSVTQYLKFPSTLTANTQVHIKLSLPAGLLNVASLLGNVEIGYFSGLSGSGSGATVTSSTKLYDNSSTGGLVNLLNGNGTNDLIITVPACDGIYVNLNGIISGLNILSTKMSVFYAYYINNSATGAAGCPTPIDVLSGVAATTGIGNIANALGSVDGVWNAIDADPNYSTYATMNVGVGVLSRTYIDGLLDVPAQAHDSAAVVLQDPGNGVLSLLSLGVLSSLSIQPYMDNTPVGSEIPINSSLLRLEILPTAQNIYKIAVPVDAGAFNKIEVRFNGIADVARGLRVYNIGVVVPAPVIDETTEADQYAYQNGTATLKSSTNAHGDPVVWFKDAAGTIPVTSISTSATGPQTFYAASERDGCTSASALSKVTLHVVAKGNPAMEGGNVGTAYSQAVTVDAPTSGLPVLPPTYSFTFVSSTSPTGIITTAMNTSSFSAIGGNLAMANIPAFYGAGPLNMTQSAFASTNLGDGLSYNDATNTIEGTPTAEGNFTVTFKVTDESNHIDAGQITKTIAIGQALPVSFTNFDVNLDANKNAVLSWTTESEQGSVRFDVQRSNDGNNFTTIGSVSAAGVSTHAINYSFTDVNPGAKSYYKVSIVKADGVETSKTVSIAGGRIAGFSINPNPASNNITITGISNIKTVSIYDASGRLVQTATNSYISVRNLSAGIYFVTVVTTDGNKTNGKFIKK